MNYEKMILEIVAVSGGGKGHSQKGDVSKALADQGFFDGGKKPAGLERDKQLSGGNPVDVKKDFFKQNPN